jgi:HK97 family phage portal protein
MLDRLRNFFRKEEPIINHPLPRGNKPEVSVRYVTPFGAGAASWSERSYEVLAEVGYRKNSDVYACVSLIATAGKQVKWEGKVFEEGGKRFDPKPSLALLAKSGGPSFIEAWLSYILLAGNSFVQFGRNDAGKLTSLYLLQPLRVTPKDIGANAGNQPVVEMWRVVDVKGNPYPVAPADMMHSKLFNPLNPILGMAPLEAAMLRVDAQNEGATLMKRLLERGYAPGWIEAAKDSLWEDTQVAQLKQRMKQSKLSGEEIFLENAAYHPIGFNPIDSGVSDQSVLSKRDIASVFHVDPALIGDTTGRTYATYRESRLALYMEAVVPLLSQFRDDWNQTIGRELESPLQFDKDSFDAIAAARAEASDRVLKLWQGGLITQDEGRRDLEYDPAKPGDVFYAPANFLPLGETKE